MAFMDERLPIAVADGFRSITSFNTEIASSGSGIESRDEIWSQPLGRWEVGYNGLLEERYVPLQNFSMNAHGRSNSFRFRNWTDYKCSAGVFVMLTSTTFQMYKRYTYGGVHFDRKILLPVTPSIITGGTVSSINYATGVVTMTSGTPSAWTGQFDFLCRFDVEGLQEVQVDHKSDGALLITYAAIPVMELRQP